MTTDAMTALQSQFMPYITALQADDDIPPWSGYMPDKKFSSGQSFFELPAVVRALLIADGTVTMALEAIYKEPITVKLKDQAMIDTADEIGLLGVEAGEQVFFREVQLLGSKTNKSYVRAFSLLKRNALSDSLWERLRNREVGMGVVLRNAAQGSFRKVLHIGTGDIDGGGNPDSVHRTYSVNIDNAAAILITEIFSLSALKTGR